jgi:steroid 5-alpha reductase family enzyme
MIETIVKRMSKGTSLAFCGLGYIVAFLAAMAVAFVFKNQPAIVAIALADLAATIVIFLFSLAVNNSSFYDPYWSVAPIPIVLFLALTNGSITLRGIFVIVLVLGWALRLTWNWMRRWHGFQDEDWRYADFRKSSGKGYWAVSLFGFHLFPTAIVFLALIPLFPVFEKGSTAFNAMDVIAAIVAASAILIESIADRQLWDFKKKSNKKGRLLDNGLWAWSRHPNYFGEIIFWCGIFIFGAATGNSQLWMILGPIAMILLFALISVPLADTRMKIGRPAYVERIRSVSAIVPLPPQHLQQGEALIPLRKRPLDIVILGYFLFNFLLVSYIISLEQIAIPNPVVLNPPNFEYPAWPPKVFVDVVHWWEGTFDPLLLARPVWYKATIWIDVLLFGPFTALAAYAFFRRRNWIRIPAIIYSAIMFTNVTIIMSEEIWGPHAAANPLFPVLANAAWFIFPFIITARMWGNDHPFTTLKKFKQK